MTEPSDPLSIAALAAHEFFVGIPPTSWFWHIEVRRLFTNDGWLITGVRDAIVFDKEKAA